MAVFEYLQAFRVDFDPGMLSPESEASIFLRCSVMSLTLILYDSDLIVIDSPNRLLPHWVFTLLR